MKSNQRRMDRAGIASGIVAILVGLVIGYGMLAFPENINPAYPIWIALLAPLAFVFGGLHICAQALRYPGFLPFTFKALALCLLVIVNWAACFSPHIHCRETISFLGVAILERYPSEAGCRTGLRILIACIDAVILIPLAVFVWRRLANRHREA